MTSKFLNLVFGKKIRKQTRRYLADVSSAQVRATRKEADRVLGSFRNRTDAPLNHARIVVEDKAFDAGILQQRLQERQANSIVGTQQLLHNPQLREAVILAKAYVTKAIEKSYQIGKGAGPLNQLFRFHQEQPLRGVHEVP